jgi:hypothetical protein
MITEAKAAFAVRYIELTSRFIRGDDLCIRKFRTITSTYPTLAVSEIPSVLCVENLESFGGRQLGPIAGTHAIRAVGDVSLMLGNGQRDRFRLGEFRTITGRKSISTIG